MKYSARKLLRVVTLRTNVSPRQCQYLIVASSSEANGKILRSLVQRIEQLPSNLPDIPPTSSLIVCDAIERRLKWLVLQSKKHNDYITSLRMRIEMYDLISNSTIILGSSIVDQVESLLVRLLENDFTHWTNIVKSHNQDNELFLSTADSTLDSSARGKKRRRNDQGRGNDNCDFQDVDTLNSKLKSTVGETSEIEIRKALDAGMRSAKACFDSRGMIHDRTTKYLHGIELLIIKCFKNNVTSPDILDAASAAAISGGSNRLDAFISPIFESCARNTTAVCVSSRIPIESRQSAITVRSMCEAIVHPKGPPTRPAIPISSPKNNTVVADGTNLAKGQEKETNTSSQQHIQSIQENGERVRVVPKSNKDQKPSQFVFNVKGTESIKTNGEANDGGSKPLDDASRLKPKERQTSSLNDTPSKCRENERTSDVVMNDIGQSASEPLDIENSNDVQNLQTSNLENSKQEETVIPAANDLTSNENASRRERASEKELEKTGVSKLNDPKTLPDTNPCSIAQKDDKTT